MGSSPIKYFTTTTKKMLNYPYIITHEIKFVDKLLLPTKLSTDDGRFDKEKKRK